LNDPEDIVQNVKLENWTRIANETGTGSSLVLPLWMTSQCLKITENFK
jgi:hypothetical protein